jgi:stress response protein YsnF
MTDSAAGKSAPLVLSQQELLQLPSDWVAVERLRIRRRIVSETVAVPVVVRREELLIERLPRADGIPTAAEAPMPLVVVLHEEVPVVSLDVRPYEQVIISVVEVAGEQTINASLDSERVEVLIEDNSSDQEPSASTY